MDTQITSYKLVPLKIFEELRNACGSSTTGSSSSSSSSNSNSSSSNSSSIQPHNTPKRSVKDIQDEIVAQMIENDDRKKSDTIETPSIEQQLAENVKTYGGEDKNNITWIYDDQTKLPQFSAQSKIGTSLDKYLDILNSKNIPENIKLQLATLYKTKYDRTRKPEIYRDEDYDDPSEEDQNDINLGNTQYAHYSGPQLAIALILSNATLGKMPFIKKLAAELMKYPGFINWNYKGILTHPPKYRFTPHIDIARFIDIMVTKSEKPTDTEKGIILNIVRPFYQKIKSHVKNTELLQSFQQWDIYQGQSSGTRPRRQRISRAVRRNSSPLPPTLSPQTTPRGRQRGYEIF